MHFEEKYLKYKNKYIKMKGGFNTNSFLLDPENYGTGIKQEIIFDVNDYDYEKILKNLKHQNQRVNIYSFENNKSITTVPLEYKKNIVLIIKVLNNQTFVIKTNDGIEQTFNKSVGLDGVNKFDYDEIIKFIKMKLIEHQKIYHNGKTYSFDMLFGSNDIENKKITHKFNTEQYDFVNM